LVAAHPAVLIGLQVFGALYLARLAYMTLKDSRQPTGQSEAAQEGANSFRRGLTVNLANPKVGLFFAALLPQFLGSARNPFLQLMLLGVVFQLFGLVTDITAGWTAAALRAKVLARPGAMRTMTLVSGGVLTLLAVLVATDAVRSLTSA
jgi:threonine/homoserine/homoserine lactone efflux protein